MLVAGGLSLWLAAGWVAQWTAPASPKIPPLQTPPTVEAARNIAARHLLSPSGSEATAEAAQASGWKLLGLSASSTGSRGASFALLQDANGTSYTANEGSELVPGQKLHKVYTDRVEIERGGIIEEIRLDPSLSNSAALRP